MYVNKSIQFQDLYYFHCDQRPLCLEPHMDNKLLMIQDQKNDSNPLMMAYWIGLDVNERFQCMISQKEVHTQENLNNKDHVLRKVE